MIIKSPYLQGWFLFIEPDGRLSTDRSAARVSIGAMRTGRVRLRVPDGLDLAPDVAEKIAGHITEAVLVARDHSAAFRRSKSPHQAGDISVGVTTVGMVRVSIPDDLDMAPLMAEAIGRQITESAATARSLTAGHTPPG
jgi:hypothetical protein